MELIDIEQLSTRFQKAGFELFQRHYSVPIITGHDMDSIFVDMMLPEGKLRFFIQIATDVDPYMLNISSYNMLFNRRLLISDVQIAGIHLKELEAQIAELDYAIDPFSASFLQKTASIQEKLTMLGKLERKSGREQYEIFVAKYWNKFDFGSKDEVIKLREKVINQHSVLRSIPVKSSEQITPWEAYQIYIEKKGIKKRGKKVIDKKL